MAVVESSHPLVKHKVSLLRDAGITTKDFRALTQEIGSLLMYEATKTLPLKQTPMQCWSGTINAPIIATKQPTIVPILRAGLGMLDGALSVLPCAKVSVVGLARNEQTLQPESYYENLVPDITDRMAIVVDPMLATGGSAIATINLLKQSQCKHIVALFLVAAPEGVSALESAHPDIDIFVAQIDDRLNEQGYILPGLGDAGDKLFGTV
ncbi:uracil phosphoribosyltransferase [Thalassotalea agarivorans]|uniref:Uracil phosphoribosyltransferase n=1 Tax=Thalassotalea agarivorans TaxID=349064 RepID=A0A1I0DD41_THASX|nr:uracil phosphoribosyltransferase [Thalassotalea agarivorans]SET30246.1 uracil phosphoribosyltransferase [Thalassotalea agarivorans]